MSEQATETGGDGPVFDNEMAEILESFIIETREIFERLGQDLLTLEKGVTDNELLNTIFRAVHTIKGTSSFLGLEQMTALAHVFEDVLNKLRRGEITVNSSKMDVMFEAYDIMKDLLQRIEARNLAKIDLDAIIEKLRVIGQVGMAAPDVPAVAGAAPEPSDGRRYSLISADLDEIAPSVVATPAPVQTAVPHQPRHSIRNPHRQRKAVDTTIRVDVARLDSLMNLVGELVLGRNRLTQISYLMNQQHEGVPDHQGPHGYEFADRFHHDRAADGGDEDPHGPDREGLQQAPASGPRPVKETGKEIDLITFGEDTELDKSIIEELNDPLVHLMRNAADHGVESTADRRAAGKSERARSRFAPSTKGTTSSSRSKMTGAAWTPRS